MSMTCKQPIGQKRLTNVAVVRFKKHGKRFEIACYKNKVISWRNKVEKDIDEVLQSRTVYQNVSKGVLAKSKDLLLVFGSDDHEKVSLQILEQGELQVSDKEREVATSTQWRDIAKTVVAMTMNPETERPYTIGVIERLMHDVHFSVDQHRSSKQQALDVIRELQAVFPIVRARMKLCISTPRAALADVREAVQALDARVEGEEGDAQVKLTFLIAPAHYRACDALAAKHRARLEIISTAERNEEDVLVDLDERGERPGGTLQQWELGRAEPVASVSGDSVVLSSFSEPSDLVQSLNLQSGSKATLVSRPGGPPSANGSNGDAGGERGGPAEASGGGAGVGPPAKREQRCGTCQAGLGTDTKVYREHFKSEWHKHNLKRKVQGLQPLSAEECLADMEVEEVLNDADQYCR